jgi:galacturan 1,4-alpha-galacturonidase
MGSVKNVSFTNVQVSDVKVPIMIDQFYCDESLCRNKTRAVQISGVKYNQITGTYSERPIQLACSSDTPCTDIDLIDIQLKPSPRCQRFQKGLCWNSYGKSRAPLVPSSIDYCLRSTTVKRVATSHPTNDVCFWKLVIVSFFLFKFASLLLFFFFLIYEKAMVKWLITIFI